MQSLNTFKCPINCQHKECQRHDYTSIKDCNEVAWDNSQLQLTGSSIFLENVIDLAHTLAHIMTLCGIHECKAKAAIDIITYTLLHYDSVCYCVDNKPMKRLRKEDVFYELGRKCLMNRIEARLCYNIIKRGFQAFYYLPHGEEFQQAKVLAKLSLTEECVYEHAAKRTAECYAQFEGLSCAEKADIATKIQLAYNKFYNRLKMRKTKTAQVNCNCCFCSSSRGHFVYGPPPPCMKEESQESRICPRCGKDKRTQKLRTIKSKCPKCKCSHKFCSPKPDTTDNHMVNTQQKAVDTQQITEFSIADYSVGNEENQQKVVEREIVDQEESKTAQIGETN